MQIDRRYVQYKNAFNCRRCPGKGGADGCPKWWVWKEINNQTGEERLVEQCGYAAESDFEARRLSTAEIVMENVIKTRNVITDAVTNVVQFAQNFKELFHGTTETPTDNRLPNGRTFLESDGNARRAEPSADSDDVAAR